MERDESERKALIAIRFEGWFRPPTHFECSPRGDARRYLWVCEPTRGAVYGCGYEISHSLLMESNDNAIPEIVQRAGMREMLRRVRNETARGPGEMWEAFIWHPVITRLWTGNLVIDGAYYDVAEHRRVREILKTEG